MSQPLTDQRPRAELIAELYDRYAAGLFAYCADQLGDLGSASDVLASVLSGIPDTEPPRAALYAFARREIHRRDVVYAPPAVDPLIDPATALVERTLRELRPHQREVLVLCAVCGLSKAELAWVLDVAPDTAEELAVGAGHRFRQALGAALASTGLRVPKPIADVYGALGVAPLHDVLGRLPWPQPPAALRIHFAGSRTPTPAPLFVKPRWPSPPVWPQPLAESDPASSTMIFPKELLKPPSPARVSQYEATTAPMPKVRNPLNGPPQDLGRSLRDPLAALDTARPVLSSPHEQDPFETDPRGRDQLGAPSRDADPFGTGSRGANLFETGSTEANFFGAASRNSNPFETGGAASRDPNPFGADPWGGEAPSSGPSGERPFFLAEPADGPMPFATGDVLLPKDSPEPFATGDVLLPNDTPEPSPGFLGFQPPERPSRGGLRRPPRPGRRPQPSPADDVLVHKGPARPLQQPEEPARQRPEEPGRQLPEDLGRQRTEDPAPQREEDPIRNTAPLFKPRPKPSEPVYRMPLPWEDEAAEEEAPVSGESLLAPRPVRARPVPQRRPVVKPRPEKTHRRKDRHYDWAWELIGFLICVAIAMIVFFSVPMFVDP
ncbi:RNA polymerase sigma factor [Nonomuraea sp. SYSU D8015]|uniref:RNA polymerase sigma factor n=1 Tax=Nonomuraea sp. SYSU D8015 TaxID=2593644 RepID=UPI00166033E0|nr:sigma-70 family RNA polymerase sigma factor [Nonomuraea sp. SYSU D8015]